MFLGVSVSKMQGERNYIKLLVLNAGFWEFVFWFLFFGILIEIAVYSKVTHIRGSPDRYRHGNKFRYRCND